MREQPIQHERTEAGIASGSTCRWSGLTDLAGREVNAQLLREDRRGLEAEAVGDWSGSLVMPQEAFNRGGSCLMTTVPRPSARMRLSVARKDQVRHATDK